MREDEMSTSVKCPARMVSPTMSTMRDLEVASSLHVYSEDRSDKQQRKTRSKLSADRFSPFTVRNKTSPERKRGGIPGIKHIGQAVRTTLGLRGSYEPWRYEMTAANRQSNRIICSAQDNEASYSVTAATAITVQESSREIDKLLEERDGNLSGYLYLKPQFKQGVSALLTTIDTSAGPTEALKFTMDHSPRESVLRVISPNITCDLCQCAEPMNLCFHFLGTTESYLYDKKTNEKLCPYQRQPEDPLALGHRYCVKKEGLGNKTFLFTIAKDSVPIKKQEHYMKLKFWMIWMVVRIIFMPIILSILLCVITACNDTLTKTLILILISINIVEYVFNWHSWARNFTAAWKQLCKNNIEMELIICKAKHMSKETLDRTPLLTRRF